MAMLSTGLLSPRRAPNAMSSGESRTGREVVRCEKQDKWHGGLQWADSYITELLQHLQMYI
jgi:hypothetical protein